MSSKAFILILVAVLVLGASLGGAFAGGIALGKSQEDEAPQSSAIQIPPRGGQGSQAQPSQSQPDQLRNQIRSGELAPEDFDQIRQQFQDRFGDGGEAFAGRGGLTGTLENINDGVLTVNTSRGPLQAIVGPETTIQELAEGAITDLKNGLRVTIIGERDENGAVVATSVLIIPEGLEGLPGGGFLGGGGRGGP